MRDFDDERIKRMLEHRPVAPKRAVVTGGMPYGSKDLHYGHVLGMFVYADFMARFLRDRIGKDNVIFVSGTDCYGSPALEEYRKKCEAGYTGSITDMVSQYHDRQKADLDKFEISLDFYGASAVGEAVPFHNALSSEIFNKLYLNGHLKKMSTLQFYDEEKQIFLNGRQVIGKCPYDGCASERGYADECELGHQYQPKELIDPVSTLSGKTPVLKEIANWYFDLPSCLDILTKWVDELEKTEIRPFVIQELRSFLKKPEIYIKRDQFSSYETIANTLPKHELKEDKSKASFVLVFDVLEQREQACDLLTNAGVRYRTGKTLTPFRLSGNISWGVPVPSLEGLDNLTFYVWPESLWAPISFTKTYLSKKGMLDKWKDFWCSEDSYIYQVLGEDNLYFYSLVQHAMWLCCQEGTPSLDIPKDNLQMSHLIVNKHSLFLGNKASSSGQIKPPKPNDLLNYYTVEQLRMHFLGLSVGNTSSSFMPKPFDPDAKPEDADPVAKDGNLLTNVYNRILRTLFYTWQNRFDGKVPNKQPSIDIQKEATMLALRIEKLMFENKFHVVMNALDQYIRNINKYWVARIKDAEKDDDLLASLIADCLYMCKVAMVALHPVSPANIERLAKDLRFSDKVFDWNTITDPVSDFVENASDYHPKWIEPRYDFFVKHPSQFESQTE